MKFLTIGIITFTMLSCGGETTDHSTDSITGDSGQYLVGEAVYKNNCIACHQANGQGVEGAFPPLAGSDYLLADKNRAIGIAANGLTGEIKVNGEIYNSTMASQGISNQEVVEVMNYILNAWGNDGGTVTLAEVEAVLK